jgi:septal ring-binding cell division protein DamX
MAKYKISSSIANLIANLSAVSVSVVEMQGDFAWSLIVETDKTLTQTQLNLIRQMFPWAKVEQIA